MLQISANVKGVAIYPTNFCLFIEHIWFTYEMGIPVSHMLLLEGRTCTLAVSQSTPTCSPTF